jgi:hypothetical protein
MITSCVDPYLNRGVALRIRDILVAAGCMEQLNLGLLTGLALVIGSFHHHVMAF